MRMQSGKPSATAYRVALRRAAHQLIDSPKILDDPLALRIIGAEAEGKLRAGVARERTRGARALRLFMAVRSRFAEDELAAAVARGVRQFVVLGAGLDTSAYRHPHCGVGLRSFEVDFPATQAWKRRRLASAGIEIPAELTFVPVDFETQTLASSLESSGLGVTMYLTRDALFTTLRLIAALPVDSAVVFDYAISPSALGWLDRFIHWSMARRVAKVGEPWITFFRPAELETELRALGFNRLFQSFIRCSFRAASTIEEPTLRAASRERVEVRRPSVSKALSACGRMH